MASLEKIPSQQEPADDRSEHVGTFSALEAWLKRNKFAAALAGGVAIASCDHAPVAQAAEITPEASWEEGVNILKVLAYYGHEEHAGVRVTTTEGAFWGDLHIVAATVSRIDREFLDSYMERLERQNALAGKVTKFCSLHTHALEGFSVGEFPTLSKDAVRDIRDGKKKPPLELPSPADFDGHTAQRARFEDIYKDTPSDMPEYVSGAVTPMGIIYYGEDNTRPSNKEDYYRYITRRFGEGAHPLSEYVSFARQINSATHKGETPSQELLAFALEALGNAGYAVRFVSYDELPHEPPCAGVDYHPQAEKK